jgi:hypothetical protein
MKCTFSKLYYICSYGMVLYVPYHNGIYNSLPENEPLGSKRVENITIKN